MRNQGYDSILKIIRQIFSAKQLKITKHLELSSKLWGFSLWCFHLRLAFCFRQRYIAPNSTRAIYFFSGTTSLCHFFVHSLKAWTWPICSTDDMLCMGFSQLRRGWHYNIEVFYYLLWILAVLFFAISSFWSLKEILFWKPNFYKM